MKSRFLLIFPLLALLLTLASCGSHRAASEHAYTWAGDSIGEWQTIYMPVNLQLTSPKQMSMSGRATLVKGDYVHLSMRMLGMEVAVVMVNSEHFIAVDKYHKIYVQEPVDRFFADYDLSIEKLQNILLGIEEPPENLPVSITFGIPMDTPCGPMSPTVLLSTIIAGKDVSATVDWKLRDAKWNVDPTVNFSLSNSYRCISGASLLEALLSQ